MKLAIALKPMAIACLLLACSPAVFAQDKKSAALEDLPEFSASEIRGSIKWKIYHSGSRLRVEPSSAMATVFAPKDDKVFNLLIFPEKTDCILMKTSQAQMMRSPVQLIYGPNTTISSTGSKEVVDGHTCTVLDAVTKTPDGNSFKSRIWAADDLKGVPVRIDVYSDPRVVTSTYQDIVVDTLDPALFKLPENCVPLEKTYQVAPKSSELPGKPPADHKAKANDSKPQ